MKKNTIDYEFISKTRQISNQFGWEYCRNTKFAGVFGIQLLEDGNIAIGHIAYYNREDDVILLREERKFNIDKNLLYNLISFYKERLDFLLEINK